MSSNGQRTMAPKPRKPGLRIRQAHGALHALDGGAHIGFDGLIGQEVGEQYKSHFTPGLAVGEILYAPGRRGRL
ncbi:hypothetical protein MMC30_007646 [Trapelia coarctata]|nr:hypothetical protein [Trapelia coarctata]